MTLRKLTGTSGLMVAAVVVNVGLFGLAAFLTTQHQPRQDIVEPVDVSLVSLEPPDPPQQEEAREPEPPPAENKPDFAPDLVQPSLTGADLGGIAMNLEIGDIGERETAANFIFDSGDLDQAPQQQVRIPPDYPYKARERGIEGYVAVKFLVREDGSVSNVNVLKAKPKGLFEEEVRKVLPKWRFQPGRIGGDAVASWMVTTIRFDLN